MITGARGVGDDPIFPGDERIEEVTLQRCDPPGRTLEEPGGDSELIWVTIFADSMPKVTAFCVLGECWRKWNPLTFPGHQRASRISLSGNVGFAAATCSINRSYRLSLSQTG